MGDPALASLSSIAGPLGIASLAEDSMTRAPISAALGKLVNVFGGKGAREGVVSSVAVKGDRKATMSDTNGQIIDLAEEKIYDLDLKKKTADDECGRRIGGAALGLYRTEIPNRSAGR